MGKRMSDRIAALRLRMSRERFMFEELVKRDFKKKYKRTILGMGCSILNPLLTLLVMRLVFTQFFGRGTNHYTTYLFSGLIIFNYYSESTQGSMNALTANKDIILKVKVSKYLFILSRSVSSTINFLIVLVVYFVFVAIDGVSFHARFFILIYPVLLLPVFCLGVGMILSAMQVFFRDTKYLYSIFIILLRYLSAIFYNIDSYSPQIQRWFLANPVYAFIKYFRVVVINGNLPSLGFHLLLLAYTLVAFSSGALVYKICNRKFPFYL